MLGASALAGGLAYFAFRRAREKCLAGQSLQPRADVEEVLQQYLVESMEVYLRIYQERSQAKNAKEASRLRRKLGRKGNFSSAVADNTLEKLEQLVCRRNGWTPDAFSDEVLKRKALGDTYSSRAKHRKIMDILKTESELLLKALNGEVPRIVFEFPYTLSKEVTLKLLKWIVLSNAYETLRNNEIANSRTEVDVKQIIEERKKEAIRKK